jgi:hypothetical protein
MGKLASILAGMSLVCLLAGRAQAAFGGFQRITPETQEEHDIFVQVLAIGEQQDAYRFVLGPMHNTSQGVYLIICKDSVPPAEQDFREYRLAS